MGARTSGGLLGKLRSKKPEPPPERGGEQRSLALAPLLEWLSERRQARVVDLGAAHGENLALFSTYECRIQFLDLYAQLREVGQTTPQAEIERTRRLIESTLDFGAAPKDGGDHRDPGDRGASGDGGDAGSPRGGGLPPRSRTRDPVDLVLFWDLVNYLSRAQIEGVCRALMPRLTSGSRAFLLLAHSPQLPLHPRRLRIAGTDRLVWDEVAPSARPCPQYSEHELHKMFPDFVVERSFLMRHGVREYLLTIPETREQDAVDLPS